MIRSVVTRDGSTLLRKEKAEPTCGEDFCDSCGDCLACYADCVCFGSGDGGEHYWVRYVDDEAEA